MEKRESIHGQWSSRWVFVLAATGSAVGLGNIWKFPYITGENGGGAFVLVYLLCIAVIGVPTMMAEIMLGRRGRRSPINTMRHLAEEEGRNGAWKYLGWAGVAAGFLILSYYSVIAGWALAYFFRTAAGVFTGQTADGVGSIFSSLISDPERLITWHTIFMVMTTVVVARGVKGGLEKAVRYLMPALFILLIILVGYAMNTGAFQQGLEFLFTPNFDKITADGVLIAMGHAFFTLSLGMGAIMVYGSYLPQKASIAKTTVMIAIADTVVALLAGMAIFPIVFANGLEPGAGPGLIFQTLPIAFGQMPGGELFGSIFFMLLVFAAWSSAISLIEPMVAYQVENMGMNRIKAASWTGMTAWLLGLATVFSFNIWSEVKPLSMFETFADKTIFDLLDYLTSNIMLPLGGLLIALFAAWQMSRASSLDELAMKDGFFFKVWRVLIRYVTPVAVSIVFLNAIGLISIG
ncbi:sodium-dependent transporter [Solemya pervernicosa gill symbiont]|uniref:Transporter n=2 Tax=Gammaproteobacteria incertae sedis TaxID=118884 RepID=A0A1T2L9G3_9GAMM|nr:sodium-dependent transporter [Candidatus Reidiella endopervernicosa]OOZ41758.1 sodium-dependent transporter [Solemya pervernicosa gill symbiont]QKQ26455.1 sodium-dependent transporter [Candidatus Reidiella endopervernicosa]